MYAIARTKNAINRLPYRQLLVHRERLMKHVRILETTVAMARTRVRRQFPRRGADSNQRGKQSASSII